MSKISEIISKQVVSVYEAKIVGTVVNVTFDEKLSKLKSFIVIDENSDEEYELSFKDVYAEKDSFIVKNLTKLKGVYFEAFNNNPINKICLSVQGEVLGKVTDIEVCGEDVATIILNNGSRVEPKNVLACESVLIINCGENKVKMANFAPRTKKVNTDNIVVKIQEEESAFEEKIIERPVQLVPPRFVAKTLLRQISLKTIKGLNNEIIVKKGEQITNKVLERAKLHNVLNQLISQ